MYLPCSKITIGSKYFGGVHDIKIKRSIHTIGATAVSYTHLTLPTKLEV